MKFRIDRVTPRHREEIRIICSPFWFHDWFFCILLLFILQNFYSPVLWGQTILLQQGVNGYNGCRDAHIFFNKPFHNTGGEDMLEATGNGGQQDAKHALIFFDLSHLPTTTLIASAELMLYLTQRRTSQGGVKTLVIYRLLKPWGEGSGNDPDGFDGRAAQNGECNWYAAQKGVLDWGAPGAAAVHQDYEPGAEDSLVFLKDSPTGNWYMWDVSSMVQYWVHNPDSNFGMLVRELMISPETGILDFASRDYSIPYFRPILKIVLASQNSLVPGPVSETHSFNWIIVEAAFSGDSNQDAEVYLSYREYDGDWQPEVSMNRMMFKFTYHISGLTPGLIYDIRLRYVDPDSVVGDSTRFINGIRLPDIRTIPLRLSAWAQSFSSVRARLVFSEDANHNNSAQLWHRQSGQTEWVNDGQMHRQDSLFQITIYGLCPQTAYELKVQVQDIDGIVGDSVWLAQVQTFSEQELVHLDRLDSSGFSLTTGHFKMQYDRSANQGYILIFPEGSTDGALATRLINGSLFDITDSTAIQSWSGFEDSDSLVLDIHAIRAWAEFSGRIICYKDAPGLIRWQVAVTAVQEQNINQSKRDLVYFSRLREQAISASPDVYADQLPLAAGLVYFSDPGVTNSTVLYFQNFTALNPYFNIVQQRPFQDVLARSEAAGFLRPVNSNVPYPLRPLQLCDTFIQLFEGEPLDERDKMVRFLEGLSNILGHLPVPEPEIIDWHGIVQTELQDLLDESCWVSLDGQPFLRAYVDVPQFDQAELISQLDVLVAIKRYERQFGNLTDVDATLEGTLPFFFNDEYQTVVNNYPNAGIQQGDSWYTLQLHLGLAALSKMGDSIAQNLLMASLPAVIDLAHHVNYEFPVFFSYDGNLPVAGSEKDAVGGYAYLMLDVYEMTGDSTYLAEARQAIQHFGNRGFNLAYEIHMSAAGAAACARLYKMTNDPQYLYLSYIALANIFRQTWLWECDYGYAEQYRTFMGLSPMPLAGVITSKEQHETYWYLGEYRALLEGQIPSFVQRLVDQFLTHTPSTMKYTLPPYLPSDAVVTQSPVYQSINHLDFSIPLEDLREGWERSGQLGQQIYGAGMPLTMATMPVVGIIHPHEKSAAITTPFRVLSLVPNPFNQSVKISVQILPGQVVDGHINMKIFNILGQLIYQHRVRVQEPGMVHLQWAGINQSRVPVTSGIYLYWISFKGYTRTGKLVLIR